MDNCFRLPIVSNMLPIIERAISGVFIPLTITPTVFVILWRTSPTPCARKNFKREDQAIIGYVMPLKRIVQSNGNMAG